MVNWQITATTIYCDAVDDEVTLLVHKDWTTECIGFKKYGKPSGETSRLLKRKGKQLKRRLECEGPECSRVIRYKEKLLAEETGKAGSGPNGAEAVVPSEVEGGSPQ